MYTYQTSHCHRCCCERPFRKRRVDHALHATATLITLGLWLVGWMALTVHSLRKPWRCAQCGTRRRAEPREATAPTPVGATSPVGLS